MKQVAEVKLNLSHIEADLFLTINERSSNSLWKAEDASEHGEAQYQLMEGYFYDYVLSHAEYFLEDPFDNIVQPHKSVNNVGRIAPNIYVGTLEIPLYKKHNPDPVGIITLEVQSVKSTYRDDYRHMLEFITEKCTDLLLQANSPVYQHFEVDYTKDSQTLYQKFAFIKSIIGSEEFAEAVHRIVTAPATRWTEASEEKDIRNVRRFTNANIKDFLKAGKRTGLPGDHYLKRYGVATLPDRISSSRKVDSVDTPENRFIKHALENFLKFCTDVNDKANTFGHKKMLNESEMMIRELENQLHHMIFREISRPTTLKLNSPVLQRKEGYREVLRVWLMFDLAAKLIWKGGDDVYSGGKKDVATLYEYWLFFQLLDLFQSIFAIEHKPISELIKETPDGLNLQIRQGKSIALEGVYDSGSRKLNIRFSYNRTFSGKRNYPASGSWTTTLRPDYTLSIWPLGISEEEAEIQELIVHIHFDAKYKIANLREILPYEETVEDEDFGEIKEFDLEGIGWFTISDVLIQNQFAVYDNKNKLRLRSLFWEKVETLNGLSSKLFNDLVESIQQSILSEEKTENRKGTYKNADLLKMHAYKDAIRRTGGAYVLYPGEASIKRQGFHEVIPGLGAFPVKPAKTNSGIGELQKFVLEVIEHFVNRASQREKIAYRTFDIHRNPPASDDAVEEALPEPYGENRGLLPAETYVLVGYYRSAEQYEWITQTGYYNFRMGSGAGSLVFDKETVGSKYLLLHTSGDAYSGDLWRIVSRGPKVFSKGDLIKRGYPSPTQDNYLVIQIEPVVNAEFANVRWDFKKLSNYSGGRRSGDPFTTSLAALMRNIV